MKASGLLGLLRVAPAHPVGPDGKMALGDHLRELRARLLRSVLAIVVAVVVSFFVYEQLLELIMGPYRDAVERLPEGTRTEVYVSGIAGGLMLQLKLCGVAGLVVSSPVWLYQIWAFILPGLHRNEKRWTMLFVAIAGPLFMMGVATSYYVLPTAIKVLIGFTPEGTRTSTISTASSPSSRGCCSSSESPSRSLSSSSFSTLPEW